MPLGKTSRNLLDKADSIEITLELDSFAGGENTIGTDQELKKNECRVMRNWEPISKGGMVRAKGLTKVIDGTATYTGKVDLSAHHFEGNTTASFYIVAGNLLKKNSAALSLDHASDAASFTSGVLSHAVSAANALWITNSTDNLKRKALGAAVAAPSGVPAVACERIYEHPTFRLVAEGNTSKTVYGSRTGSGNWTSADAWSASNDAWSMTFPDITTGAVMGFPSGNDITVFTKFDTNVIYNIPNVAKRKVLNGIGCWNGYTVSRGNEGVYFFSTFPTRGIFLWNGSQFINLTQFHDFVDDIALANRMFGVYKDQKYYFFYNESNSGVSYPNRLRIYDAKFGMWRERLIASVVSDNLGYPAVMTKDNNELYSGSSQVAKIYEIDDATTSDNASDTIATYTTKNFYSQDFTVNGNQIPLDNVRIKLLKTIVEAKGNDGSFSILWSADNGKYTGSQTFQLTSSAGDLLNTTFTVNTSYLASAPLARVFEKSFSNMAVGKSFSFQINNTADGTRPEIRKIKIMGTLLEER